MLVYPNGQRQLSLREFPALDTLWYDLLGLSFLLPRSKRFGRWRMGYFDGLSARTVDQPMASCLLVRREVFDAVGLFDEGYRIAADYDFMLRAMELHDFRPVHIDRVLVDMMHGGRSTAGFKAYVISNHEASRSRQRWLDADPFDMALFAKPLRKVTQFLVR